MMVRIVLRVEIFTYFIERDDRRCAAQFILNGTDILAKVFGLRCVHDKGTSHHIAQPGIEDGVEAAARPQLTTSVGPCEAVRLGDTLGLADDVQRLPDGGVLHLTAADNFGRSAHL